MLTPQALRAAASHRAITTSNSEATIFYTDASIDHTTQKAGAAFTTSTTTGIFRLPDGSSPMQAESVAICQALLYASSFTRGPVSIYSDSQSAVQSLQKPHYSDNICLLTKIFTLLQDLHAANRKVTLTWLPSHADGHAIAHVDLQSTSKSRHHQKNASAAQYTTPYIAMWTCGSLRDRHQPNGTPWPQITVK